MFKNIEKFEVGRTGNLKHLRIPLPTTPDGRVYRYSPNEKARPRHFVIGERQKDFAITDEARKRMKRQPGLKQTVCPYTGVIADDDAFVHPEDRKAALETVEHAAVADVTEAIYKMFESLSRSSKHIKITANRSAHKPRPRFWRRDLLRELVCDHCGRDYGVFAIGLFCPDCGAPNLNLHFAREVDLVSKQVALAEAQQGQQELAYRLMGNAHEDVLTAFEATLKTVYLYGVEHLGNAIAKPVRNDFQNIEKVQTRFAELKLDPFSILTPDELGELNLNIQKRHILGHNLGIMDERFSDHAENAKLGETVQVVGSDILRFARFAQRIVEQLDDWLVTGATSELVSAAPSTIPMLPDKTESEILMEKLNLSDIAIRVGKWLAQNSKDGLVRYADIDKLVSDFSDVSTDLLEEGVVELEMGGYIQTSRALSSKIPRAMPTIDLFATFDPIIGDTNPVADSKVLAEKILSRESVSVPEFQQEIGWPLRRFNPALGLVLDRLGNNSISREVVRDYPVRWIMVRAEDRISLRRYIERFAG